MNEILVSCLATDTHKDKAFLRKLMERDHYMTAEEVSRNLQPSNVWFVRFSAVCLNIRFASRKWMCLLGCWIQFNRPDRH